jgi:hypothetical protein
VKRGFVRGFVGIALAAALLLGAAAALSSLSCHNCNISIDCTCSDGVKLSSDTCTVSGCCELCGAHGFFDCPPDGGADGGAAGDGSASDGASDGLIGSGSGG